MHLDIKATVSSDHTCKLYQQLQAYISFGFKHTTLTLASRISTMSEPEPQYYEYEPALAAAVTFVVLFLIIGILHTYQLLRTRTWVFIPFVIGGFFEVIGYIGVC